MTAATPVTDGENRSNPPPDEVRCGVRDHSQ
jgi:hypothetical protein